jgi:cell shape-determining protein MreD
MRGRFDRYGFVMGLVMGVIIGVLTGSIALWMAIGVVMGIAITHARFRHKLPRNQAIEIIPPEPREMRR